jgi:hypothetical protein
MDVNAALKRKAKLAKNPNGKPETLERGRRKRSDLLKDEQHNDSII